MPEAALVAIDDRAAMKLIADQVITLGHKHIAVLCMRLGRDRRDGVVPPGRLADSHFHVQRERIAGVKDAMADAGLDRRP